jgi:hypothetical protein
VSPLLAEVGAIQVLKRSDIVDHRRLRIAPRSVRICSCERGIDVRPVTHGGICHRVMVGRQGTERSLGLMRMLQPEGMADLVHECVERVVPLNGNKVRATRGSEPGVPSFQGGMRVVTPSRIRRIRFGKAQVRVLRRGFGDLRKGQLRHRGVLGPGNYWSARRHHKKAHRKNRRTESYRLKMMRPTYHR